MSHPTKIAGLTDELISAIAGLPDQSGSRRLQNLHDISLRGVKQNSYRRTNQFEIYNRLDGLEEKFRVLDRDDLADALRKRLNELSGRLGKWTPEALSLLLELSDQPATKSNVENLEHLKPPDSPPTPTWAQIIANDPLSDDDVWEVPGYSSESSEDDATDISLDLPLSTNGSQESSLLSANLGDDKAHAFVVPIDTSLINDLEKAQFWKDNTLTDSKSQQLLPKDGKAAAITVITELQAVREVLFLLSGLPTSLFEHDARTGQISPDLQYALQHSSPEVFQKMLLAFAEIATKIHCLRNFIKKEQVVPLMQTFRAAVEGRLRDYDLLLSTKQERFVGEGENVIISLIETFAKIQVETRPLQQLATLVTEIKFVSKPPHFVVLELLHEQSCVNQMVGDDREFAYMVEVFFECFRTYLDPIRKWMEHGELGEDDGTFFVLSRNHDRGLASLWHDRYALQHDAAGKLHAPRFLHTAAEKVFNTGKSVVFLQQLGMYGSVPIANVSSRSRLNFQGVCQQASLVSPAPFSELFDMAFDDWINSKHHSASRTLRDRLYSECGLWRALDALEYIYFHKDGALSSVFTTTVLNKIDRAKEAWNDRFLLTELAQSIFGSLSCVDAGELAVRSSAGGYRDVQSRRRSVKILTSISIDYALPWPIQNIIRPQSLLTYQRILTFLLQVCRVKCMLERRRLLKDNFSAMDNEDGEVDLSYSLRHRLLWLANTLYKYLTDIVLAPSSLDLRKDISDAVEVDAMIAVHDRYVLHLEDRCLISKRLAPIHQAIISLLDLGIHFCDMHAQYAGEKSFDITNRSITSNVSQLPPWRRKRRRDEDDEDDSSEHEDDDEGVDTSYISFQETAYVHRLQKTRDQFERLCGFVTVGLRGVSRAGGEPCWEILAKDLDRDQDSTNLTRFS
ncbi:MAG: hypothetical protein M1836_000771 [Candelina mexicana]|nr:MAG: hypothetical protein M1836_000771 [Candelina mexicana]